MSIQPQGEDLRKAVKWISEEKTKNSGINLLNLINEACMKFDLSPNDSEFLSRHFTKEDT